MKEIPDPKNKKQWQQFLGVCNCYRNFTTVYANTIDPFRKLLRDNSRWEWNNYYANSFRALKNKFLETVTIKKYLPNKKFKVQTDASNMGICGLL